MIQQNCPSPQQTKPYRTTSRDHPLTSNTPKDLKQTIVSHLRSHKKLILSIEPLPNVSGASISSLLTPSGQPLQIEIHKKKIPLKTNKLTRNKDVLAKCLKNYEPTLQENIASETIENYPQRYDLKTSYISARNEEAPPKYQNNHQHKVPEGPPTQKKSSKVPSCKLPLNTKIIHIYNKRAPDLAINPLKEEIPFSTVRVGTGFNRRIALKKPHNTSHIGAVLECLYHLPNSKNLFSLDDLSLKDPGTNQLRPLLKDFFHLMDTSSAEFINQAAWKITRYLLNNPILQVSQDPVQVFRTVIEELMFNDQISLCDDNDNSEPLKLIESLHIVEISIGETIRSCLLDRPSMEISFSNKINAKQKSLRDLQDFPRIIAIALKPHTKREAIMPKFTINSSRKGLRSYEFHAGVFEIKGGSSNRSIAVIQCNGKGGSYYQFEDDFVKKVQLNEKVHIPRLIFYRSEN